MTPSTAAQRCHAVLSEYGPAFLQAALGQPAWRQTENFKTIQQRERLTGYAVQNWPLLADAARMREFGAVAVALERLLQDVPQRCFDRDPRRLAEFYGLRDDIAQAAARVPRGPESALTRGDFLLASEGLKLLEFNCGGFLGGWYFPLLAPLFLEHPLLRDFLTEHGLRARCRPTPELLFTHLVERALGDRLALEGEVNVALALRFSEPESEYARRLAPRLAWIQQVFGDHRSFESCLHAALPAGLSGNLSYCAHADFEARDEGLFLAGRRQHAILEYVGQATPAVQAAAAAGRVHHYAGTVGAVLNDKRNLALLSEGLDDGPFDEAERALIRAHVPWSRRLRPITTRWHGEDVDLPALVTREREQLVLKQGLSYGGHGVHLGLSTPQAEWDELARRALEQGTWLVQERVDGLPLLAQSGDDGASEHDGVWGLYVFGGRYGGVFLRLQPRTPGAVVNLAQGAAAALVFEVE